MRSAHFQPAQQVSTKNVERMGPTAREWDRPKYCLRSDFKCQNPKMNRKVLIVEL